MRRVALRANRCPKRRWATFATFVVVLGLTLFLLGFEEWELWMMTIILYYTFWLLRRD